MTKYLQEITAITANGARHTIHIEHATGTAVYDLEMFFRDPKGDANVVDTSSMAQHPSAAKAFEAAVATVKNQLAKDKTQLTSIDNPCNDPFIKVGAQAAILQQQGIAIAPKLNGK